MAKAGDYLHLPSGARHGWRNVPSESLVAFINRTTRLGQFFQEVGRPVAGTPQSVTAEDLAYFLAHFATVSASPSYDLPPPVPEKIEEVKRLVLEFEASGLRRSDFCRNRDMALSTLRRHLKISHAHKDKKIAHAICQSLNLRR